MIVASRSTHFRIRLSLTVELSKTATRAFRVSDPFKRTRGVHQQEATYVLRLRLCTTRQSVERPACLPASIFLYFYVLRPNGWPACSKHALLTALPAPFPHFVFDFVLFSLPALVRCQKLHPVSLQGRGLTPDIRGGLPLKMVSTTFEFDQAQFDAARQKMKACPPMEASRLDFKGAAGTSSSP